MYGQTITQEFNHGEGVHTMKKIIAVIIVLLLCGIGWAEQADDPVVVRVGDFSYPLSLVQQSLDSGLKASSALNGEQLSDEEKAQMAEDVIGNIVGIGLIEAKLTEAGQHDFTDEEIELMKSTASTRYEELWQGVYQMMVKNGMDVTEAEVSEAMTEEGYDMDAIYREFEVSERQRRAIALFVPEILLTEDMLDEYYESQFLAPDRERYADDIPTYEREILNTDSECFYTPEGYRAIRQILLEYPDDVEKIMKKDKAKVQEIAQEVASALTKLTEVATSADDWSEMDEPRAAYDAAMAKLDAANRAYVEKLREVTLPLIQDTLDAIDERLDAGIDFKTLISKYSTDTSERNVSGAGYPIHPKSEGWPAEFLEAAMALEKPGDVSEPVLTEKGIHILYYDSDIPAGDHALTEDEKELLKTSALHYYQVEQLQKLFEEWKPEYDIETHPELLEY